jgi:hypothetical protein
MIKIAMSSSAEPEWIKSDYRTAGWQLHAHDVKFEDV